jgi:hypothetical protein
LLAKLDDLLGGRGMSGWSGGAQRPRSTLRERGRVGGGLGLGHRTGVESHVDG